MPTLTATCLVGRVEANALIGSELSSDSRKFPNVTKGYSKFFEVARRISVSLMEIT